jgi:ABC-type phosphate/phosphonate transport system substrate-binding protein
MLATPLWMFVLLMIFALSPSGFAADPSWPKEVTFALLSTESAPDIIRRWRPILAQL